jgi:hypothetical protein
VICLTVVKPDATSRPAESPQPVVFSWQLLFGLDYAPLRANLLPSIMRSNSIAALVIAVAAIVGCSKKDDSATTGSDSTASSASSTRTNAAADSGNAPVRGTLASITDTDIVIAARNGNVSLPIASPLTVYERVPAKLSDVKSNSFVGVTSVAQPDGSQRATEIHIFPEQLRGMGEGSRPMAGPNGRGGGGGATGGGGNNTMTNGTVSQSQMTNGTASTMTNGTISGQQGGTLTVQYAGGTQTIAVPGNVTVTAIAPTKTKPAPGANVVVVTAKQPDGSVKATAVMIAGGPARGR